MQTQFLVITGEPYDRSVDQICDSKHEARCEARDLRAMGCTVQLIEAPLGIADELADRLNEGESLVRIKRAADEAMRVALDAYARAAINHIRESI